MINREELEIVEDLGVIWNKFLKLPDRTDDDNREVCSAIHQIQNLVMARPVIREIKQEDQTEAIDKVLANVPSEPYKSPQDRNLDAMEHGGRVEREIYNWQQYGDLGARDFISTLRNCGIKPNDLEMLANLMRGTNDD